AGSAGLARWQREATLWSVPGAAADLAILGPHEVVARRDDGIAIVSADDGHAIAKLADAAGVRGEGVRDPTKRWLAFATADRGLAVYDLASRARVAAVPALELDGVVLVAPDGERVVARRGSGMVGSLVVIDRKGTIAPLCNLCWLARAAGRQ